MNTHLYRTVLTTSALLALMLGGYAQAALAWHEYDPQDLQVSLFSKGGDLKVKSVSAWQMKSCY